MIVAVAGIDVHVEGEGGETIVMVHGWPDTYRLWDAQVDHLKAKYRCIRFTLPGFDDTQPRRVYAVGEVTDFIRQVVEQLNAGKKVTLMLHDWGCIFGYEFYMRHPQLVARIVGVDVGSAKGLRRVLSAREKFVIIAYQMWLVLAWKIGGKLGDGMTRRMARWAHARSDPRCIGSRMNYPYYLAYFGGGESLPRQLHAFKPECPMLFVYGRRKPMRFHTPAWLDELRTRKENQVEEFDTGHWVMLQQPERFNRVAGDWLAATRV
ncbi:MAG: alpha/beta hydrolase [Burkholderiales bacterium]